ncbi:hydantoinase/oxoprolinase family protein [Sinisalibacter aestuarii]|uniref:Hydantoinase n=1 Tax=Sinisalibacter aestuarii TaxID=2949426 RepID=A0ABQ5LQU4_9RHOB|nr:hydantoinase/oxoprolinase family protein [Sinisalibacter aestuarii]GKY87380.1 hydantoinase [Sinisalibacter aestuarii]
MIRIGVDVGGTNTDAVVMRGKSFVAGAKSPTTPDVTSGAKAAIGKAVEASGIAVGQVDAVMLGTTHFVNALVRRKELSPTGIIRLCLPSGASLTPFADWPRDLVEAIGGKFRLVNGGYEMDGREIAPLDKAQLLNAVDELKAEGCTEIAVSAVFSTIRGDMESEAAALIRAAHPDLQVTASQDIGRIGLLERENAAIINSALRPLAVKVVAAFARMKEELGLTCPVFFTRNDGTLIDTVEVERLPVLTFASGPTNSMRGAAFLSGLMNALVVDIGGTTSDVGEVRDGFPRLAGTSVTVADVQTNFSMPDVVSLGLGGGSIVNADATRIGPDSVGLNLLSDGIVFGGATLTASDIAVAAGRAEMGSHPAPEIPDLDALVAEMDRMLSDVVARSRTSAEEMPVLAVGGGSVLMGDMVDGLKVVRPAHHDLANAVGAAIAQVSGEVSKIMQIGGDLTREAAIKQITQEASDAAVSRGADPKSLSVLSVSDVPLAYLPGNNLAISVTVVGDLNLEKA